MANLNDKQTLDQNKTATRIADGLSVMLGASYASETLGQDTKSTDRYERLSARIAAVESRRQGNIEAVAQAAFDASSELADEQPNSDVDSDWLARFIDLAQDIGNGEMQQVWGHLLAQECTAPGTVSYQLLDILSSMVSSDLDLLENAGRIRFPTGYLLKIGGRNEFVDFGIDENDISRLQSLNLVRASDDLSVTFYAPTKGITFDFKGCDLIVRHPTSQMFILPAFQLTPTGQEMMGLLADVPADMAYLSALGQDMRTQGYDYRVRDGQGALIEHV